MGDKDEKEYEDVCYMCHRTERTAGKMFHFPNNICVCSDCLRTTMDKMSQMDLSSIYGQAMADLQRQAFQQPVDISKIIGNDAAKNEGGNDTAVSEEKPKESVAEDKEDKN